MTTTLCRVSLICSPSRRVRSLPLYCFRPGGGSTPEGVLRDDICAWHGSQSTVHTMSTRLRAQVVLVVAIGGAVGAVARFWIGQAMAVSADSFPWATFTINVSGSFLLALLPAFAVVVDHPLLPPALGTGVLGGYTTLSSFAEETRRLAAAGHGAAWQRRTWSPRSPPASSRSRSPTTSAAKRCGHVSPARRATCDHVAGRLRRCGRSLPAVSGGHGSTGGSRSARCWSTSRGRSCSGPSADWRCPARPWRCSVPGSAVGSRPTRPSRCRSTTLACAADRRTRSRRSSSRWQPAGWASSWQVVEAQRPSKTTHFDYLPATTPDPRAASAERASSITNEAADVSST